MGISDGVGGNVGCRGDGSFDVSICGVGGGSGDVSIGVVIGGNCMSSAVVIILTSAVVLLAMVGYI